MNVGVDSHLVPDCVDIVWHKFSGFVYILVCVSSGIIAHYQHSCVFLQLCYCTLE